MTIRPMAICLEDLDAAQEDERYLRCVATPGGEPGLGLDGHGVVRWMPDGPTAYELWVSADGRLALQRGSGSGAITVSRGGRSLEAPPEKPVILLDQDLLEVAGRRLRVHVHGEAQDVHEPTWLSGRTLGRMARAAAAALALGTAVGAGGPVQGSPTTTGGETAPIDVRARPPKPVPRFTYCEILKLQTHQKKGQLLSLECKYGPIRVGMRGQALDQSGDPVKNGQLTIKEVKGRKVIAETRLKKLGKAKRARFHRY